MTDDEIWLTVTAAAVLASRSERTIYRWIADGRLAAYDAGSRVLVAEAELLALIAPTARRERPRRSR